jgi:rod shape-determining protein MreC
LNERYVRWILVAVLFLQLVVLTAQTVESGGEPSRVQAAALWVVAPVAHLVDGAVGFVERIGTHLTVRSSLLNENQRLRRELAELKNERIRWFDAEGQMERLATAVEYAQGGAAEVLAADVIYVDDASWLSSMMLFVGEGGVSRDLAVVAPSGVVGRVVWVTGPYAKVQLLTDRSATVGGMISRTRRQGIVRGAEGGLLSLDFVPLRSDVRVGDEIVTAGIDGIYPRGVPVGRVATVEAGDELFYRIEVTPAVEFARLDQAYVLGAERLPRELKEAPLDARP